MILIITTVDSIVENVNVVNESNCLDHFLSKCKEECSDFENYDSNHIADIVDDGYFKIGNKKVVSIHHLEIESLNSKHILDLNIQDPDTLKPVCVEFRKIQSGEIYGFEKKLTENKNAINLPFNKIIL